MDLRRISPVQMKDARAGANVPYRKEEEHFKHFDGLNPMDAGQKLAKHRKMTSKPQRMWINRFCKRSSQWLTKSPLERVQETHPDKMLFSLLSLLNKAHLEQNKWSFCFASFRIVS